MIENKSTRDMTSEEKLDAILNKQSQFQDAVGELILRDSKREEDLKKALKHIDELDRKVNEEMKIRSEDVQDIKKDVAVKVRKFCTDHHLIYSIWSKAVFAAAYGVLKEQCQAGSLPRILFSKTDLAKNVVKNMDLEELEKIKMLLVEARINDGKRFKVDPEKENYLYETIRYHIVTLQDWETVSREQIFKEASINELNGIKY